MLASKSWGRRSQAEPSWLLGPGTLHVRAMGFGPELEGQRPGSVQDVPGPQEREHPNSWAEVAGVWPAVAVAGCVGDLTQMRSSWVLASALTPLSSVRLSLGHTQW